MYRITKHAAFALCLCLGTSTGYILAQKKEVSAKPVQAVEETPINRINARTDSEQREDAPGQSIKFGAIELMSGYTNGGVIILRESADANAPIKAKLKVSDYDTAVILGSTRDFLHVRFKATDGANNGGNVRKKDYEGWATWASIVPDMSAIVLDAETGAVVARVPLYEGISSVTFSPDNSRALFSDGGNGPGRLAYEVRTSDYTLTRSLTSANDDYFGTLFYGPADGALYTTVYRTGNSYSSDKGIGLLRIGEEGSTNAGIEIDAEKNLFFIVSPDGLVALRARQGSGTESELTIDVIELATMTVRNTFSLSGASASAAERGFILSRDGSELYLSGLDTGTIPVIDTRTGQQVRELTNDHPADGGTYFSQGNLIGDSLLLSVWGGEADEMQESPQKFWVSDGKRMLAEPGIDYVVAAGGKRYAVNADGTLLFKLDDNNRIQKRLIIDRPERRKGADNGNGLSVFGLSASPDGKHLILFVGMAHGC